VGSGNTAQRGPERVKELLAVGPPQLVENRRIGDAGCSPDGELTVDDAMRYLEAQSLGAMDTGLVETFVRTGPEMLDFVEAHSELQFEIAAGFPDYKPELPGGRPSGGRSLNARPFDLARLGDWSDRITSFPADWSNVGIDAETRARIHASVDASGDFCVAGWS
jgi:hypothetical protein